MNRRNGIVLVVGLLAAFGLADFLGMNHGPGDGASAPASAPTGDPASTLSVIAGSELQDLAPYFDRIAQKTGVTIAPTYSGTLAAIDRIETGEHFDAAWFSTAKYLVLSDTQHRIKAETRTMLTPVVVGVKESVARKYGWLPPAAVTWRQIADKAGAGAFSYAMTNPTSSNSGFSAVMAVATAFSNSGDALDAKAIDRAALKRFYHGQKLVSGSSGWLADAYVRDQDGLDGIVTYESAIAELNAGTQLHEKLVAIFPREGVVTADYPLVLLDSAKKPLYDKVVAYITSPEFQTIVAAKTYRRPIVPGVALAPELAKRTIVDVTFPGSKATVDAILASYLNADRTPAHTYFIIDTSGSMQGERIAAVRTAIDGLAGDDTSLTGKFARFAAREKVTMSHFSTDVSTPADFAMARADDTSTFANIKQYVADLTPDGGTAIYSAVERTLEAAYTAEQAEPNRYYTIVLMTDGENNDGDSVQEFKQKYQRLPAAEQTIRVFPILFGEGSSAQLTDLAATTGGRVFDGRSTSLAAIFKEIRGYQ